MNSQVDKLLADSADLDRSFTDTVASAYLSLAQKQPAVVLLSGVTGILRPNDRLTDHGLVRQSRAKNRLVSPLFLFDRVTQC